MKQNKSPNMKWVPGWVKMNVIINGGRVSDKVVSIAGQLALLVMLSATVSLTLHRAWVDALYKMKHPNPSDPVEWLL